MFKFQYRFIKQFITLKGSGFIIINSEDNRSQPFPSHYRTGKQAPGRKRLFSYLAIEGIQFEPIMWKSSNSIECKVEETLFTEKGFSCCEKNMSY